MSANELITSTTCAESIDFGTPAIAIMIESQGRLRRAVDPRTTNQPTELDRQTGSVCTSDEPHYTLDLY